jgi:hypothetical protein
VAKGKTNVVSFFGGAIVKTSSPKKGKTLRETPIAGLRNLRACKRLRAVIYAVETNLDEQIKLAMAKEFNSEGCRSGRRPDNFTGTDEEQEGNCQLRARSFGPYGMSEDVAAELTSMGLGEVVETKDTFQFNDDVLTPEMMQAIDEALAKAKYRDADGTMRPLPVATLIQRVVKRSLASTAIDTLFASKRDDPKFVAAALPLISTLAIRCDYDKADDNVQPDAERVAKLLADPTYSDLVRQGATEPEKVLNPRKKAA